MLVSQIKIGKNVCVKAPNSDVWYVMSAEQARKNFIRWFGDIKLEKVSDKKYK